MTKGAVKGAKEGGLAGAAGGAARGFVESGTVLKRIPGLADKAEAGAKRIVNNRKGHFDHAAGAASSNSNWDDWGSASDNKPAAKPAEAPKSDDHDWNW